MSGRKKSPNKIDWNERLVSAAKKLLSATRAKLPLAPVLKEQCPHVYRQIKSMANYHALLQLWGTSENFDENAGKKIVDAKILKLIGELSQTEMTPPVVHAGLQHTYGYLFSLIKTPFGYKRDRWLSGEIEAGLGIPTRTFHAKPSAGSLLLNLTYFLGRIALTGRRREIALLRRHKQDVAQCLVDFNYRKLRRQQIIEVARANDSQGKSRRVELRTELIPLATDSATESAANYLLIYWLVDDARSHAQLLTTFTVTPSVFDELTSQECGRRVQLRARFNSFIEGITGESVIGTREIA